MNKILNFINRFGVYILAFVLPLQTRYIYSLGFLREQVWEYSTISIFVVEVFITILIFLALLYKIFNHDEDLKVRNRRMLNIEVLGVIFLTVVFVSVFFADNVQVALMGFIRLLIGVGLAFLLLTAKFSLHKFAQIFLFSGVLQSIFGIYQFYSQKVFASTLLGVSEKMPWISGISVIKTVDERFLRAYGTLPHPNILAAFLVTALVVCFGLIFTYRSNREKFFIYISSIIISAGLFYTFSRTGYLVLLVSLIIIALYLFANKNKGLLIYFWNICGLILLISLLLSIIHKDIVVQRFSPESVVSSQSVSDRVELANIARKDLELNWRRGVGIGNYTLGVNQKHPEISIESLQPVHNIYLLILNELGIGGFAILIMFIYEVIQKIIKLRVTYTAELLAEFEKYQTADLYEGDYAYTTHWYVCLSSILVGLFVWGMFDHFFWTLSFGILLFFTIFGLWLKQFSRLKR